MFVRRLDRQFFFGVRKVKGQKAIVYRINIIMQPLTTNRKSKNAPTTKSPASIVRRLVTSGRAGLRGPPGVPGLPGAKWSDMMNS